MTKRFLMTVCCALSAVSAVIAQEAPSPKPADNSPSLEVTMKFIQDKLDELGTVHYAANYQDATGQDIRVSSKVKSGFAGDPNSCRFAYRLDNDVRVLDLRQIADIVLMPEEQYWGQFLTAEGDPPINLKVEPAVFRLLPLPKEGLRFRKTSQDSSKSPVSSNELAQFEFYDFSVADRLAKAMVHAVELCGGGSQPEPF